MNPGYVSLIMICIAFILFMSGWKDTFLRGFSDGRVVLFFIAWCLLSRFQLQWGSHVSVNLVVLLLGVTVIRLLALQPSPLHKLHLISSGLFLGSLYYLFGHLSQADPAFLPFHSPQSLAVLLGLLAVVMARKTEEQLASITVGLLIGHLLDLTVHRRQISVHFAGFSFQDQWWTAVSAARITSVVLKTSLGWGLQTVKSWNDRWKGWRK